MGMNRNRNGDAGSVNTPQFFQKYGIVPVIQPLPAVFGIVSKPEKSQAPHFFEKCVKRGLTPGFPFLHIRVNLFFDKFPDGLADHFMIFVEINLTILQGFVLMGSKILVDGIIIIDAADRFVAFGEERGMKIIGHTLVWHSQTPRWVFQGEDGNPPTRELMLERMREHIFTVAGRYKGRIHGWDVVNEALNDDGTLTYSFVESLKAVEPYHGLRLLGGLVFFSGMLIMAYNVWKTVSDKKPVAVAVLEPA